MKIYKKATFLRPRKKKAAPTTESGERLFLNYDKKYTVGNGILELCTYYDSGRRTPVVFSVTAYPDKKNKEKYYSISIAAHLIKEASKPHFTARELLSLIDKSRSSSTPVIRAILEERRKQIAKLLGFG